MLCITFAKCNNIGIYQRWLDNLDQFEKFFGLENLNLNFFEVQKLQSQIAQKLNEITATTLAVRQKIIIMQIMLQESQKVELKVDVTQKDLEGYQAKIKI